MADATDHPGDLCPKCQQPRAQADASCPYCGIIYARFRGARAQDPAAAADDEAASVASPSAPLPAVERGTSGGAGGSTPQAPDVWDGEVPENCFRPAAAPAAPSLETIGAAARATSVEAWRAVPPSAPEDQPGYVGRILRRYAIGLGLVIIGVVVLRVTVLASWKDRVNAEFARAIAEAQANEQTQSGRWTPDGTTPPDTWGVSPPPAGLNAAPRDVRTTAPAASVRPEAIPLDQLMTRALGAMCLLVPVAIVLALFVNAFFVWLSAMALRLGRRFSTAFFAAAIAFGLSIAAGVMLFFTSFRPGVSPLEMQAMSLGAVGLAGALGVKLVYRAPLWLSIGAALLAGVMNAIASAAFQLILVAILLA